MFGVSRKSFIGRITGRDVTERAVGTAAANVLAYERGARVFRVHDVAASHDALAIASATLAPPWTPTETTPTTATTPTTTKA